jgi:hypothetical protein
LRIVVDRLSKSSSLERVSLSELAEAEQEAGEAVEAVTTLILHKLGTEAEEAVPATVKVEEAAAAVEEQEGDEVQSVVVEVDVADEAASTAKLKEDRHLQLPPQQLQRPAIHKLLIPLDSNKHTFRFPTKVFVPLQTS